jgi:2-oxoglutarate dehydrogenase E1 component
MDSMSLDRETGPSWARPNWPIAELDAVNVGLDPTEATIAVVAEKAKAAATQAGVIDEGAIRRAAEHSIRAMMLIRT